MLWPGVYWCLEHQLFSFKSLTLLSVSPLQVPMKLVDSEVRQLMIEFPRSNLQPLDDVTARARK